MGLLDLLRLFWLLGVLVDVLRRRHCVLLIGCDLSPWWLRGGGRCGRGQRH